MQGPMKCFRNCRVSVTLGSVIAKFNCTCYPWFMKPSSCMGCVMTFISYTHINLDLLPGLLLCFKMAAYFFFGVIGLTTKGFAKCDFLGNLYHEEPYCRKKHQEAPDESHRFSCERNFRCKERAVNGNKTRYTAKTATKNELCGIVISSRFHTSTNGWTAAWTNGPTGRQTKSFKVPSRRLTSLIGNDVS